MTELQVLKPAAQMRGQVRELLAHIEAGGLLPPLVVLQTLAPNKHLNLAVVKGYVARTLAAEGAPVHATPSTLATPAQTLACARVVISQGLHGLQDFLRMSEMPHTPRGL